MIYKNCFARKSVGSIGGARLLPVPSGVLNFGAAIVEKTLSQRLCGSLKVDVAKSFEFFWGGCR